MVEMPRAETFNEAVEVSAQAEAPEAPAAPVRRRVTLKRVAIVLALLAGAAAAAYYGHHYVTVGQYLQSTDDAYVKADYTIIAPKVPGYIADVQVEDNQIVKAGQVLARIDDGDYRAALDQARADVGAADAAISNVDAQISLQQAEIDQAKAAITSTQANLTYANADADRYSSLVKTGAGTLQRAQQTEAARAQAAAQLQHDQAALASATRKIDVLKTARGQAQAQADHSRAVQHQAELNLSYATLTAPIDGTVGARSLRVGQYVAAGTQLMAVVPLKAVYIIGNFKETQLTHVRRGQPVAIDIDSFPDLVLRGHVDSISPASGLEFSLLPPDNATGNFTKIVQRIPVKITIDGGDVNGLLRAGMSVEPTIDTKAAAISDDAAEAAASSSLVK